MNNEFLAKNMGPKKLTIRPINTNVEVTAVEVIAGIAGTRLRIYIITYQSASTIGDKVTFNAIGSGDVIWSSYRRIGVNGGNANDSLNLGGNYVELPTGVGVNITTGSLNDNFSGAIYYTRETN